jgi:hypothetical protein
MTNGIFGSSVVAGLAERLIAVGEAPAQDDAKKHLYLPGLLESIRLPAVESSPTGRGSHDDRFTLFTSRCAQTRNNHLASSRTDNGPFRGHSLEVLAPAERPI